MKKTHTTVKPVVKKQPYGRVMFTTTIRSGIIDFKREFSYHATKGWRSRRA